MTLSATAKKAMASQETAEVFLTLIELSHDSWDAPLYLVNDSQDIVSNGQAYQQFPFQVSLPGEADEGLPVLNWSACNVDRLIVQRLRGITGTVEAVCSWIIASEPDHIQRGPYTTSMQSVAYNAETIGGTLGLDPILDEPFGRLTMTPATTPALF